VAYLKSLLFGGPLPDTSPVPISVFLNLADITLRPNNLREALHLYEKIVSRAGGFTLEPNTEYSARRLAFLYGRLGRVSDSLRAYEQLATYYLRLTPPDAKKAHAARLAAARLHFSEPLQGSAE